MQDLKVIIADDEEDILDLLEYNLQKEGCKVWRANNGLEVIALAETVEPDIIMLDIMMPKMDGVQACIHLRNNPKFQKTHILFLTARSEEYSEVAGFEAGADDYIIKPIKPRILISRIKAILRRNRAENDRGNQNIIHIHDLEILKDEYVVRRNQEEILFARKEFELLCFLAAKPGKIFQREEILEKVWGNEIIVVDRTIDVHIRRLREKLGDDYIITVKGVGYKFTSKIN